MGKKAIGLVSMKEALQKAGIEVKIKSSWEEKEETDMLRALTIFLLRHPKRAKPGSESWRRQKFTNVATREKILEILEGKITKEQHDYLKELAECDLMVP